MRVTDEHRETLRRNYPHPRDPIGDPLTDPGSRPGQAPVGYGPALPAFVTSPECEQCADGKLDAEKLRMAVAGERTLYLCETHMSARGQAA